MRTYLVIDIGTSSLKGAVMNSRGELLSHARLPVMGPSERSAQFSTQRWIDAVCRAVPRLVAGHAIDAVVLSGNGPTVVPVFRDGSFAERPLLWLDGRRVAVEGSRSLYIGKVAWYHQHDPNAARVRWYLPFPEFLIYWMTGCAVATTPSKEFEHYIWTAQDAQRVGVPPATLPPYVTIGSVVGKTRREISERLGLPPATPVVAAGSDFLMSLVGTDTLYHGRTCDRAGTSEGLNHCSSTPIEHPTLRTLPHVVEGYYNVAGILSATGLLFEWFREISGQKGRDYGEMMFDILDAPDEEDAPLFFPSMRHGSAWEFQRGMFVGLGAEHTSAVMGRAVVLSIGFAVKEALGIIGESGCKVDELRACGGQAKNGLWVQMKADITGVPIRVPRIADAELVGDLCAGMLALREVATLQEAASLVVHTAHVFTPNDRQHRRYHALYERHLNQHARYRVPAHSR